jgi:glyceraldehyde-3-phosphate dehydrogenase (NADP+)
MMTLIKDDNNRYRNLINGEWVNSKNSTYITVTSPIDNSVIGNVPAMTKDEVDLAVQAAKEAQKSWKSVTIGEKAEVLYRAADILLKNKEELAGLMVREIAKDRKSGLSEVERTADFIKFTADTAKNISGESIPGDSFPGGKTNKVSIVRREPLGVVLAISPFNYPVNLAASKIAPGLMAGNSVILKPATQGSLCGLYLARVFQEAGVPNGVLNTVTGKGSEIGDYITTHPGINFINFTGSTEVGQHISHITNMVPLLMELGGKDAAIVLEDADLELTANNIVSGGYSYSGQRCTAVKRILAVDQIADQLVEKIISKMEKLTYGNPLEKDVDIVPLISSKAADFVCELMDDAREKGAKLLVGGDREGNIIHPTLFDYVTTDMRIAWEEPFGPVLPIIRVKDKDEAIEIANASEYGLQSAVFTQNINDAFYVADRLEVGTVQVNNKTERGPDHFPFLGVKASGIGTQGIRYSIESMSRPKVTVINLSHHE